MSSARCRHRPTVLSWVRFAPRMKLTVPQFTGIYATILAAATLCWTGCGDDTPAADGSTGGQQTDSGDATGSTSAASGTPSTSDTTSGTSTGQGDEHGPSDSTDSGSSAESTDTDSVMANCVERPEPDCPPAPGAISTELADGLIQAGVATALDVRGETSFTTEHLPGATVLNASELRATVNGVSGQVAAAEVAQEVFEAAGISPTDALIVYADGNGTDPARVVWTLAYYGHMGPVWMLDGGLDQWTAESRDVEVAGGPAGGGAYPPAVVEQLWVDEQWVLDRLDDPTVVLVDARSDAEFSAGHIPGALSVDWVRNLGRDGLYLPVEELRALYGDPADDQTLVTYCQTGSRASVDWLVLTMLGYDDVRIYDGSWSEWSSDPTNPVE